MARQVLPVVGAIVGTFFGAPQLGWAIGAALGNAVDPAIIKGPTIGEIPNQTSQEGTPRPIVFALSSPIAGNIIATGPPRIVKKRQRQGKGGPKVETESVYRTYAIGVCETIQQFVRVWRNGILVYDVSPNPAVNSEDNAAFLERARFFLGSFAQNPSPDLETLFGVGTTPAHRGTAYMVMADDDLTDTRGAIPQYVFQVSSSGNADFVTIYTADDVWEKPEGLVQAEVTAIGGGGGAQSAELVAGAEQFSGGQGGGGGGMRTTTFDADDLPDTVAVRVGAGGLGGDGATGQGNVAAEAGADGGDSVFHTLEAGGGKGGGGAGAGLGGEGDVDGGDGGAGGQSPLPGEDSQAGGGGGGGGGGVFADLDINPGADGGDGSEAEIPDAPGGSGGAIGSPTGAPGGDGADAPDPLVGGGAGGGGGGAGGNPSGGSAGADGGAGGFPGGGGAGGGGGRWRTGFDGSSGDGGPGAGGCVVVRHIFAGDPGLTLQALVTELCDRAGLPAELIDVSELSGFVKGFVVTNSYACSEALKALSNVFFFDPVPVDGIIRFVPRGGASAATITEADMLDEDERIQQSKRGDSISIPRVLNLNYHDVAGGISPDKQTSERGGDRRALGDASLQSPVLMEAPHAAKVVDINHKVMVEAQKGEVEFRLSDAFLYLVPSDPVIVQRDGVSERIVIQTVETGDGSQAYTGVRDRQSAYTSNVEGIPAAPQTPQPSSAVGPTLLQIMDIHILRDSDDALGLSFYAAVAGITDAWQGANVEISYDGGANYVDGVSTTLSSVIGELLTELPDHPQEYPDETHTVRVRLDTAGAELFETDLAGMMNRQNQALIGDELVAFANADEVAEGEWDLSFMLRGRKGSSTEAHPVGTRFVLLDRASIGIVAANVVDIGRTLTFRATSFGTSPDNGTVVNIFYTGRSQIEREVGYLEATRDGSDAVVTWQGIGRLGGSAAVVHGARFAGYRVTFDDGVLAPVVVETDEENLTHDVSALGSPLTITVQQLNDLTGAGPTTEVELV